ncbi:hypothetical protein Taro_030070 [Colocasia esculenta]|uniref:Uncharacterized protein n=1 Tax=Colocasia esculenta TaxID=4460 RepID=A0A843VKJ4_COLES|nr:hypothetical protein [Colocasia esculenta]
MSQIKVQVQKEGTVLKGHTPKTCKKATLNSRYKSAHAHNSHCWQRTVQQIANTTVRQRTPATASPYLNRVGGEPREQGSVGITSPLPARAAGTPTSRSKTTLQSSKVRNAYHRVLQSSGNRETPRPQPGSGQTRLPQNQQTTPRHTPAETKELTEHRSDHMRPESHNTSTNNPDLHEVREGQPDVTMRDIEQPCEKQRLTTGTATSDLHKAEGSQAEPPCTSDTPRGQGTTHPDVTTDGTKERVIEIAVGYLHKTPRENPQTETIKHGPQGQPTKTKEARHG